MQYVFILLGFLIGAIISIARHGVPGMPLAPVIDWPTDLEVEMNLRKTPEIHFPESLGGVTYFGEYPVINDSVRRSNEMAVKTFLERQINVSRETLAKSV